MTEQEAGLGHNNPPEPTLPEKYTKLAERITAQLKVTNKWVTERPKITSQEMADACKGHVDQLRALLKEAEEMRKAEVKPLNDKKTEIQARFNGIKDKITNGALLLTAALEPWLKKLADEQAAAAEKARKEAAEAAAEAEAKRLEAEKALQERKAGTDALGAQDDAAAAEKAAAAAEKAAKKAEKARPQVGRSTGRAMGMITVWRAEITDIYRVMWHFKDDAGVQDAVRQAANRAARETKEETEIPGMDAVSEKKAR